MHIVVSRSVSEEQGGSSLEIRFEFLHIIQHTGPGVAFGIGLRSFHKTLGVVAVIKCPVIDSTSGYATAETLRMTHHKHSGHSASER